MEDYEARRSQRDTGRFLGLAFANHDVRFPPSADIPDWPDMPKAVIRQQGKRSPGRAVDADLTMAIASEKGPAGRPGGAFLVSRIFA